MGLRNKINFTLLLILAAALLLSGTAACDFEYDFGKQSLDEIIALYMAEYELTGSSFAMGWYDLTSGEEWFFSPDSFMVAGSMYKLPLNMAYTDKLAAGELQPDDMAGKYTVERAMELSIVYSDNEAAELLESALRLRYRDYRLLLAQYSGLDESELPEEYFSGNRISPRFMINTLVYLYDNSELYSVLIDHMKSAHPGRYFKKSEGEYEIAHKYGYFDGVLNDCAIVYTPRPFALVAFTLKVGKAEDALSGLCELMTDYSLYLDSLPEPSAAPEVSAAPAPEPFPPPVTESTAAPQPEAAPDDSQRAAASGPLLTVYAAVCAVLLALACVRHLARRRRRAAEKGGHKH